MRAADGRERRHLQRRAWALAAAAGLALTVAAPAAERQSSTTDLLARTTVYVQQFVDHFSSVVAEEHYVQKASRPDRRRELRSDFLLVKYPGADEWVTFRDVLVVDGQPVRDHAERMTKLFLDPPASAMQRAREIMMDSTRYNLADIGTINNPLIVLGFLQTTYQTRFRFSVGRLDKQVGPAARILSYQEQSRPYVLRTPGGVGLQSSGRIWVDETSAAILKTELHVGIQKFPQEVVTTFAPNSEFGIHVPVEMREHYPRRTGVVTGVATYSGFRRFTVKTDSDVKR